MGTFDNTPMGNYHGKNHDEFMMSLVSVTNHHAIMDAQNENDTNSSELRIESILIIPFLYGL